MRLQSGKHLKDSLRLILSSSLLKGI